MKCPLEDTMFLSQLPYVPLGDLRAVVSYPSEPGDIPDRDLQTVLAKVALGHLVIRLNEVQDWAKVLSPGEQQRIAFARVLLHKPQAVFMDEATSALDEGLEYTLYTLLRIELPRHDRRQRQPPANRRAAPRTGTRAARRRRVAASARWRAISPSRCRRFRPSARPGRIASRHGNVHALPGLGRRADHVGAVGGESLD